MGSPRLVFFVAMFPACLLCLGLWLNYTKTVGYRCRLQEYT